MASPVIKHSVITGAAANPDVLVDGVAWDASHTVTGLESWLAAAGKPLVILFTGQSFLTQTPALVWAPETNVFVWDWNGTTGTVGTAFVTPSSTTINLATKFASDVARANPARTVYLINISFTGLAISHWLSGASSPDVFLNIQNNITSALAAAGATKIDLFGWVQGQADCVPLNTSYIANHATMMARFWADTTTGVSWFPKETPALIFSIQSVADSNSLNADADNMNMLLQAVADADPDRRKYIYLSSLTGSTYFDLIAHPTAQGHFAFGAMAAVEFLRGIGRSSLKNLAVDPATGYIMFGKSAYSPVPFVFNNNTAIAPANISAGGNLMQAVQADGLAGFNVIDTFGNFANFIGRRRNGTQQAPTTLALDDLIVGLGAIGFDGISDTTNKASLSLIAAENWSPGHHGTYATLNLTITGTDTSRSYRFDPGSISIDGTTSGTQKLVVPAVAGSGTLTFPAATDTLVGRATTDTLTNKTLTTPVINGLPTGTGVATANTASTLVARDGSGNFSAGTITAALTGHASLDLALSAMGTGVQTALGFNIGSAGAPVTFNGAGGTPSSLTLTNAAGLPTAGLTGTLQAAQEPAHTGDVTNTAGSLALVLGNAPVIAKVLTAYAAGAGTVAATDSILQALQKLGGLVDNAAWSTYTPASITPQGGALTGATVTATCRYKQIGKTVICQITVTVVAIGSGSPTGEIRASLPVAPVTTAGVLYVGSSFESNTSGDGGIAYVNGSFLGSVMSLKNKSAATYWVNGYVATGEVIYEVP